MALSRDGRTLATASGKDADEVRLWNLVSREQRTLHIGADPTPATNRATTNDESEYRTTALAFDDSGGTMAVGEPNRVRLLDMRDGHQKLSITLGSGSSPREIRFTADNTLTTVDSEGLVTTWNLKTHKPLDSVSATAPAKWPPTSDLVLTAAPDGRTVAASSPGQGVVVLDRETGRKRTIADQDDDPVRSVALTEDGDTLATGGKSGRIRLISVRTGKVTATLRGPSVAVRALAFAPEGDALAALTDDRAVKLWDVPNRKLRSSFASGHTRSDDYRIAFRPDGRTVVTSDYSEVRVWNLDQLQPYAHPKRSEQLGGPELGLAFSPDGAGLLGVGTKEAQVWDAGTGDVHDSYSGTHALLGTAAYDREGRPLTVVDDEDGWAVLDIATLKALSAREPDTSDQRVVHEVALSPDGSTVALRRGNDLSVLDTDRGELKSSPRLSEGSRQLDNLLLSRDGTTLAAQTSSTVVVWDTATGDLQTSLEAPNSTAPIKPLVFSPDGSVLVTGSDDGPLRLWDTVSGRLDATLEGSDGVTAAAYSPDGRFLATGGPSGSVRLWETATNRTRRVLTGAPGPVASLAFAPDGGRLAVGGEDGGVELWRLSLPEPEEAIERICWAVGRDFTDKERAEYLPDPDTPPPCA
ncbi:PQQ-binding-like beta-propeller repeat protein [Streptomyces sp. R28]|uniref:PQQ-binding-like beta-propeller repeat protein n=1 Tax=Streptomyces sp. R28 TaxID=3238628 RepID=A0AB39QBY8_9ACTN